MKKSNILRLARLAITFGLILFIIRRAGLFDDEGWNSLLRTFADTDLRYLAASIIVGFIVTLVSAFKWYMLLRSQGLSVRLWRVCAYYIIGKFFNLVLPTSLGGDIFRMNSLGKDTGRYADSVASVFVERFTGMLTMFVLGLFVMVGSWKTYELPWLIGGLLGATAVAIFAIWLIIDERPLQWTRRVVGDRSSLLLLLLGKIERFHRAVVAYRNDPVAVIVAFVNSLLFYFLMMLNVWLSSHAFGANISLADMVVAVPIIMVIMNVPISIGGVGLLEFAFTFTLGVFGVQPAVALSTALLMRAKSLMYAVLGGVLYAVMTNKPLHLSSKDVIQNSVN